MRPTKVNRLLGTSIDDKTMTNLLKSIGFGVTANKENLEATVPTWRWDTQTETDVAEEIARTFGYERIN